VEQFANLYNIQSTTILHFEFSFISALKVFKLETQLYNQPCTAITLFMGKEIVNALLQQNALSHKAFSNAVPNIINNNSI